MISELLVAVSVLVLGVTGIVLLYLALVFMLCPPWLYDQWQRKEISTEFFVDMAQVCYREWIENNKWW